MPCEGEAKKWRCGICECEGYGVRNDLPPKWHSFGGSGCRLGAHKLGTEESYCPGCWDRIWPHIRSAWYKLNLIKEAITQAIAPVRPDKGETHFRFKKPGSLATDMLRIAVAQLCEDAYLTIDRGYPDVREDALCRHYGDEPKPKKNESEEQS